MTPIPYSAPTQEFIAAVSSSQLPHAWMVRGPRSPDVLDWCFQQAALLLKVETTDQLRSGAHPGCKYIDKPASSLISASDIRSLGSFVSHTTETSLHRVIIINALNDMTPEAQNSLLKKLEEPKGHITYFLIAYFGTTILATLRSRCRLINLLDTPTLSAEVSPLTPLYQEALISLKKPTPDYGPLFKLAGAVTKNDHDFGHIINHVIATLTQRMTDLPLSPPAQRAIDRIFYLVNLEKSMHVDRRHMLLSVFFNLELIYS